MATHKEQTKPPFWADRLLEWFVAPHLREDLQGDLYEIFQKRVEQVGLARAKREYTWAVLHYLTPYFFKRRKAEFPLHFFLTPTMIRNYFKIAFRNLTQQKGYSAITIFGLALGLAVSLLSTLYVMDEVSYDGLHHKAGRIYRINSDITFSQQEMKGAAAPTPMGQTLRQDFPEVKQAVRLGKYGSQLVKSGQTVIREPRVLYADSTLFDVFTLPMRAGNPKKADFLLPLHETNEAKVNKWGPPPPSSLFPPPPFLRSPPSFSPSASPSSLLSAKRAREVGVRKVMGSARFDLVFQFLSESLLITFLALLVGVGLVYVLLPYFNELSDKTLVFRQLLTPSSVLYLVTGTAVVGVLAGVYPAFYLSSFSPIKTLKGKGWTAPRRQSLRGYLVVFQFALSVLLILGTLLIHQQLHYIQTKKLGFDKEQVVVIHTARATASEVAAFKTSVLKRADVKRGTVSGFLPVASNRWNDRWYPAGTTDEKRSVGMQEWMVDPDYLPTLGMRTELGRNFPPRPTHRQQRGHPQRKCRQTIGTPTPARTNHP